MQETERLGFDPWVSREDALEEGMATHSSVFAWSIPWTKDPAGHRSTGDGPCISKAVSVPGPE